MNSSSEFVELPPNVSRAVTNTVELFARRQNEQNVSETQIEAVNYYHDEPLWFVRSEESITEGKRLVRRVQIGAYRPNSPTEQAKLHFLPDAFVYEPTVTHPAVLERLTDPEFVLSHQQIVRVFNQKGNPFTYRTLLRNVRFALAASWDLVSQIQVTR